MVKIVKVKDKDEGNLKAHEILKEIVDSQTLLALSGGTSPDYRKMIVKPMTPLRPLGFAQDSEGRSILPGAVCVVDERYGEPYHQDSNERLLKDSGLLDFLDVKGIEFYKILEGKGIEQTAEDYDQLMSELLVRFPKRVGVMGVGGNLHTAGIFPLSRAITTAALVIFETVEDDFPQRITLTLRALGQFQYFIILMFGESKKEALKVLLDENENDLAKYPAIFYRKSLSQSYLVTDINP